MNAVLNIQVRVTAAQARKEIASVGAALRQAQQDANSAVSGAASGPMQTMATRFGLNGTAVQGFASKIDSMGRTLSNALGKFDSFNDKLISTGKNLSWTGRQLTMSFTLPIVSAGTLMTKWALDNERSMTELRKVYNGPREEVDALAKSMELLSTRFGVSQKEVIDIGAAWAAAGAAGVGVAADTQATLEAMIIGDMDAAKATEALVAIQAIYGLSAVKAADGTSQLGSALADMNIIEDRTSIQFSDLIDVVQRAGGVAREAGIDIDHLGAMASALVPAAGGGAKAGNALKTIISRLQSPTAQTVSVLKLMNINLGEFMKLSGTGKIEKLAGSFEDLSQGQKSLVSSTVASRWQINSFDLLMQSLTATNGNYHKSLDLVDKKAVDAAGHTKAQLVYWKELSEVLDSNPKKFDILTTSIKNNLTSAIIPMLPAIGSLLATFANLVKAFANMDPKTQKMIFLFLAFLAIVGPIAVALGSIFEMVGLVGKGFYKLGQATGWVGKQMFSVIKWIALKVAAWVTGAATETAATEASTYSIIFSEMSKNKIVEAGALELAAVQVTAAETAGEAQVIAAELGAGAWVAGAIEAEAGWGMAIGEIAGGQLALSNANSAFAAAVAAAQAAAAGATGTVWVSSLGAIVEMHVIAGEEIVAVWIAVAGAIAEAFILETPVIAAPMLALPAVSLASAEATVAPWKLAAIEVTAIETTAMTEVAGAQLLPVAGAIAGAEATVGVWSAAFSAILSWIGSAFIEPIVAAVGAVAAFFGAPIELVVAVIAAAIALIVLMMNRDFRDRVIQIIKDVAKFIWQLPGIFIRAMVALAKALVKVVGKIIEILSYLNPFARHSPSLVDNVKAGVATILDEYGKLRGIAPIVKSAAAAHDAFNAATSGARAGFDAKERSDQRTEVAKTAPNALPQFDRLGSEVDRLRTVLPPLQAEINNQTQVVKQWQDAVDALDKRLKAETATLDALKSQMDILGDSIQNAKDKLTDLGNTDLPGMRAMEDQIFANEQAQKALRLEIMKMEDAGQTIDDVKDKMAQLQGQIELLGGERETLRAAGAGSDILKTYDDQLDSMKKQQQALKGTGQNIDALQKKLDELAHKGEELDLEKSLQFDGPLRQIDQMIEGLHEMPFDEIVSQIQQQQQTLATLQPQYDAITQKVKDQQAVVDQITKDHDAANDQLDLEKAKLDTLQDAYKDITDQIDAMTQSMNDFASASKAATAETGGGGSNLEELFNAADGADYEVPGGGAALGAEGSLPDIDAFNKKLQDQIDTMMKNMDGFELPDPIGAVKRFIGKIVGGIGGAIGNIVGAIGGWGEPIGGAAETAFGAIGGAFTWVWQNVIYPVAMAIGGFLGDTLGPIIDGLGKTFDWVFRNVIAPAVNFAWSIIQPIFNAIWTFIQQFLIPIFTMFSTIAQIVFEVIWKAIQGAWNVISVVFYAIYDFIKNNLGPAMTWLWENVIQPVWNFIKDHILEIIANYLIPGFSLIVAFFNNVLAPAFNWLWQNVIQPVWDGILHGLQILWGFVQPIFQAIINALDGPLGTAFRTIQTVVQTVWDVIVGVVRGAWNTMTGILETGINFFVDIFNALGWAINTVAQAVGVKARVSVMQEVHFSGMSQAQKAAAAGPHGGGIQFAQGTDNLPTSTVGGGFRTSQARAIVGEGSRIHEEFVIPTDPRYRKRALMLFEQLGGKLMAAGGEVPRLAAGGGIPVVGGAIHAIASTPGAMVAFLGHIKDATVKIFQMGSTMVKDVASWAKDKAYDWGMKKLESVPVIGPAVQLGADAWNIGKSVLGGTLGKLFAEGGYLPPELATGGRMMVGRHTGGTLLRVGEGRNDEEVQVLPVKGDDRKGTVEHHWHGDFVLPGITRGDEAEKFIRNIESLVA